MKKELAPIPAGTMVLLTSGEYSCYSVRAVGRATCDIDPAALIRDWLSTNPPKHEHWQFEEQKFLAWLVTTGRIEELPATEWYLGDYGDVDYVEVRPAAEGYAR